MIYYHNPKCSKSRQGKALLDEKGISYTTKLYLEDPASSEELQDIATKLIQPTDSLLRKSDLKSLGLTIPTTQEDLLKLLTDHPKLLQRPILVTDKKAALGRPPEDLLKIL